MRKRKKIPKFQSEDEEREFWSKIDLGDCFEPSDFVPVSFPNLKPTSQLISIRIPEYVIIRIKEKANTIGVPYQVLIKQKLAEMI